MRRLPSGICAVACDQRAHGNSDVPPEGALGFRWEAFGQDFRRIVEGVTARYGRAPDMCITHSFAGDCALMALAEQPMQAGRMVLLDPVLANSEGAVEGAQRLAKGTRRQGEREVDGFDSPEAVGDALEKLLRASLARQVLHPEAKAAFAEFASFPDGRGRWHLKCSRNHEAEVYANRIALADYLETRHVSSEVQVLFASKRRGRPEDQDSNFARDWREAERVVARCGQGSAVHLMEGVGHFLVLEDPDIVAEAIRKLL